MLHYFDSSREGVIRVSRPRNAVPGIMIICLIHALKTVEPTVIGATRISHLGQTLATQSPS